jgi:hypothetical protein
MDVVVFYVSPPVTLSCRHSATSLYLVGISLEQHEMGFSTLSLVLV